MGEFSGGEVIGLCSRRILVKYLSFWCFICEMGY